MLKYLIIPLYGLLEGILGPRILTDATHLYPERCSTLEAITHDQVKLIITSTERHFHVRFPRFHYHRHYTVYHVCAQASGNVTDLYKSAVDFCVDVPATYPHAFNPPLSEQAAIDHYIDQLKARLPDTDLYRKL